MVFGLFDADLDVCQVVDESIAELQRDKSSHGLINVEFNRRLAIEKVPFFSTSSSVPTR